MSDNRITRKGNGVGLNCKTIIFFRRFGKTFFLSMLNVIYNIFLTLNRGKFKS